MAKCLKIYCLLMIVLVVVNASFVFGQTTEPTPASPEETQLDEEIRLLKKEKERIGLLKDIRDAQTPAGVTPLNGTVTGIKDMFMEVETQSYKAVNGVTNRIACDIKGKIPDATSIILYKPEDYAQWRNYKLMQPILDEQLKELQDRYDRYITDPAKAQPVGVPGLGTIADVTAALKAFVGLVSFLRTDTEFEAKTVTVDELALRASIIKALRSMYPETDNTVCVNNTAKLTPALYDPMLFSPTGSASGNFESAILEKIKNLYLSKAKAEEGIRLYDALLLEIDKAKKAEAEAKTAFDSLKVVIAANPTLIAKLDEELKKTKDSDKRKELLTARDKALKDLEKAKANLSQAEADLKDLTTQRKGLEGQITEELKVKITGLRQANADFNQFLAGFTKIDSTTGISPLAQYVKAENLNGILDGKDSAGNDKKAFWLQIKAVKAGGNNRVRKNLLRFFIGPDISHSGGFIAEYMLGNKQGEVILSNTEQMYLKYTKASNIQE